MKTLTGLVFLVAMMISLPTALLAQGVFGAPGVDLFPGGQQNGGEAGDAAGEDVIVAEPLDYSSMTNAQGQVIRRDPFWPVGHFPEELIVEPPPETNTIVVVKPTPKGPVVVKPVPLKIEWPEIIVKSIAASSGSGSGIADLEGIGFVSVGEECSMTVKGIVYTWKITAIQAGKVEWERVSARAAQPRRR